MDAGDAKVKANNAFLAMFKTPEDLHNFAEKTQDSELLRCWNTCNQYGVTTVVNGFKAMMRQSEKYENMSRLPHDVVGLGTVHKVKGLEFDCVLIANDFIDLGDEQNKSSICSTRLVLLMNLIWYMLPSHAQRFNYECLMIYMRILHSCPGPIGIWTFRSLMN